MKLPLLSSALFSAGVLAAAPPPAVSPPPTLAPECAPTPVAEWLHRRQAQCLLPPAEQRQQLADSPGDWLSLAVASCDPDTNYDRLSALLADIDPSGMSESQRSLLALLDSYQREIRRLRKHNGALEQQLRDTIAGISEIETTINEQTEQASEEDKP